MKKINLDNYTMKYETQVFPKEFIINGTRCGIKKNKKNDLSIFYSKIPCTAAAVFTLNLIKAAPVIVSQKHISNKISAIVSNSGCANACTGKRGIEDAVKMCELTARGIKTKTYQVLVASTGVIGQFLPMDKIKKGIAETLKKIAKNTHNVDSAVDGIMTTDTFPKIVSKKFFLSSRAAVSIWGCCKGAGMIHPNMATMLCFILTDASISRNLLKEALREAVKKSFNRVSVDGDTSTNDSVFLLANGAAANKTITKGTDANFRVFKDELAEVCGTLSKMIASDGEGATKLIKITITRAASDEDASRIARTIATSPLVKTAISGCDANWGRIIAAAGRSGAKLDPNKIDIFFDNLMVAHKGMAVNFSEDTAKKILSKKEINIRVNLNLGSCSTVYYTCDMTREYVALNANYRS